jgi:hypothetical protein
MVRRERGVFNVQGDHLKAAMQDLATHRSKWARKMHVTLLVLGILQPSAASSRLRAALFGLEM